MGYLSLNDFSRGGRPAARRDHRNVRPVMQGLNLLTRSPIPHPQVMGGGMGLGALAGKKSRARWAAAVAAEEQALLQVRALQGRMDSAMNKLRAAESAANEAQYMIEDLGSQIDQPAAFALIQQAQTAVMDLRTLVEDAVRAYEEFDTNFNTQRATGQHFASAPNFLANTQATASKIESSVGKVNRLQGTIQSVVMRLNSVAKKAQQQAAGASSASEAARLAEERRYELELQKQEREYARQQQLEEQRIAREDAARQREFDLQQAALARQQELAAEERAMSEAERQAALEEKRLARDLELQRIAMEQEKELRAEERELRKQEREAELQRMVMLQELASKGIAMPGFAAPTMPGFPGMTPGMPMMPGFPGMPGMPGAGMQMPGMQMPGQQMPMAPGFAPAPANPFMQSQPMQAPNPFMQIQPQQPQQQPAPSGMQWSSFDPASEMFGMGARVPAAHPDFDGAMIEDGYELDGPDRNGRYALVDPDGKTAWTGSEDQLLNGTISVRSGNTTRVLWVAPRGASGKITQREVATGIFDVITKATDAAGGYLQERERRKAATSRRGIPMSIPSEFDFESSEGGGGGGGLSNGALALGAIGAGVFLFFKLKNRKKKPAAEKAD